MCVVYGFNIIHGTIFSTKLRQIKFEEYHKIKCWVACVDKWHAINFKMYCMMEKMLYYCY